MKKKYYLWVITGILSILILFAGFQLWKGLRPSADSLSKEEAQTLVETRYKGKVTRIRQEGGHYFLEMVREDIRYEIKLGISSGEVLSIHKKGKIAQPPPEENAGSSHKTEDEIKKQLQSELTGELLSFEKEMENGRMVYKAVFLDQGVKKVILADAETGEIILQKTESDGGPVVAITEEEAVAIALKQVNGILHDVELESEDSFPYYLVEIETADDQKAIIQIHALTGEVLSVSRKD